MLTRLNEQPELEPTPAGVAFLSGVLGRPVGENADELAAALDELRAHSPLLAAYLAEPLLRVTLVPTKASASTRDNVIPSVAEALIDTRVPPGLDEADVRERIAPVLGDLGDNVEIDFDSMTIGNESPLDTELTTAIREWLAEVDPGATLVPMVMPGFSDSHWFRKAFDSVGRLRLPPAARAGHVHGRPARARARRARRRRRHRARRRFLRVARAEVPGWLRAEHGSSGLRLGGMALRNGLLVHGPTSWAIAVRNSAGEVEVASGVKPTLARGRLGKIPVLRGPLRLGEALLVIPLARIRLPAARLPLEDVRVVLAAMAATAASAVARKLARGSATRETAIALIGMLPALAALRDRDLAAYHGAEHKAIGAYESGGPAADEPKEHERCGSNLIGPLLAFSVAGQVIVEGVLERPNSIARGAASLAATGAAVEVFAYAERNPEATISKAVHGTGYEIQRLISTREPTAEQLEVGEAAVRELLRVEAPPADTSEEGPAEGVAPV